VVERGTGIGRDRRRVWERRYGFPEPVRNAKGERSYPEEQLRRPQRTRRLLDRVMRPGKLLPESSGQLNKTVEAVLDAVRSADDGQLEFLLRRQDQKRERVLSDRDDSARSHRSRAPWPVGPCLASHKDFSFIGACKP
jgi:DNA-binding transcriptional MerR regulator